MTSVPSGPRPFKPQRNGTIFQQPEKPQEGSRKAHQAAHKQRKQRSNDRVILGLRTVTIIPNRQILN
jgi:hypothetical protein